MAEADSAQRPDPTWAWLALLVLPAVYLVSALSLRAGMGPFWIWHAVDPSYAYLLDAANLVNLTPPGHVVHPGTPLQIIGALVLWVMHGFAGADAILRAVIADPETHLRAIGIVLLGLNALALAAAGAVARTALGGMLPALMVQAGPFVSGGAFRRDLYVEPATLLVGVTLALAAVLLLALRDGRLEAGRRRFAIAFGAAAGFAMATDLTAAPLVLVPVFVLGDARALTTYAAAVIAAFVVCTLPAAGAYAELLTVRPMTAAGSGDPWAVMDLFGGPLPSVLIVLALAALAEAWRRRPKASARQRLTARALAGVVLAVLVGGLMAGGRPEGEATGPGVVLSGLLLALLYRLVAGWGLGAPRLRHHLWQTVVVAFAVFLIGQAVVVAGQDLQLHHWSAEAASVDDARFDRCARVYFRSASDPAYALLLGDAMTGGRLAERIARRLPGNDFWFDGRTGRLRDARGPRDLAEVLLQYPCAFFRGREVAALEAHLKETAPGFALRDVCSTRDETVLTAGVDCRGELTGR